MQVSKNAYGRGVQSEMHSLADRQANPPNTQRTEKVTVGENRHVTSEVANGPQKGVRALCDIPGHFTTGTSVSKDNPIRAALQDLVARKSLVITIVPFDEGRICLGHTAKSCQFARTPRTLQWAGQHAGKFNFFENIMQPPCLFLTTRRQRDVRTARVLARGRPLRLTVTDQVNAWQFSHVRILQPRDLPAHSVNQNGSLCLR